MFPIQSFFTLLAQVAPPQVAELPWFQQGWFIALLALAVVIVPFLLGQAIARGLRMADDGFRIGLVLFSVIAGLAVCSYGWPPRLGIDLSGGVILVYEVDPSKTGDHVGTIEDRIRKQLESVPDLHANVARTEGDKIEVTLPTDDAAETRRVEREIGKVGLDDLDVLLVVEARPAIDGKRVLRYATRQDTTLGKEQMDKLVGSIGKRVNPGGQKEVTVRQMGSDRIQVVIPQVDQAEIDVIKEKISTAGALKFRILANRASPAHRDKIEIAEQSDARQVKRDDEVLAEWVPVDPTSFKANDATIVERKNKKGEPEVLVMDDIYDVLIGPKGGQLTRARNEFDYETAKPCVAFSFDARAANLFGELTGTHIPDQSSGLTYGLGILLDDTLKTAPNIQSRISSQGQITGNFTEQEVKTLVDILNAGSLPAALSKVPVAEYASGAQLGQDTIKAGAYAMGLSTAAILAFMLVYYRFAGIVADMAVLLNVVLVLALLILIKAHLTLAGLAGLVLSVGMSVDANVLIYERIREEMERGAALRMAIRNGFSRAMSTIIDSNLTTLIVGIVLYIIGTDQLRGFATTLILGLMLNIFTAVYCARLVFDIAERKRWITELKMLKLFGRPNFDFVGMAKPAIVGSVLIVAIGIGAAIYRGAGLFGIDFTGGSAVQVVFKQDIDIAEVRKAVSVLPDVSVSAVVSGERAQRDARFNINTSDPDIEAVEAKLQELFPGQLKTHSMEYTLAAASPAASTSEPFKATDKSGTESKDEKVGEEPGDEAGKTEGAAGKTGMISRPGSNRQDAVGLIASTSPDAVLLAQAEKADANAEKAKSTPETAKSEESPKTDTAKTDTAKTDTAKTDTAKTDTAKTDTAKTDTAKTDTAKTDAAKTDAAKTDAAKTDTAKTDTAKTESPQSETSKTSTAEESTPSAAETALVTAALTFPDGINYAAIEATLNTAAKQVGFPDAVFDIGSPDPDYTPGSGRPIVNWTVKTSLSPEQTELLLKTVQEYLSATPIFPAANKIGGKVAGDTQVMAGYALFVSNLLIIIYVWVRFQNLVFGLAAVVALVHDVLIAVAALALSYWLAPVLGFLQVDQFKISLDVVAALLTIVGFSINDTIVIFDRIREVRGKSADVTATIINRALNETLSRTVLTSGTVFIVTLILYAAGGEGIHPFAFTMLIGVIAGSYSSLFVAAPMALWMRRQPTSGPGRSSVSTGAVRATGAA